MEGDGGEGGGEWVEGIAPEVLAVDALGGKIPKNHHAFPLQEDARAAGRTWFGLQSRD
jgi:hypothetical protein